MNKNITAGAQWLSGIVLVSRSRHINPCLVLACPDITETLLTGT